MCAGELAGTEAAFATFLPANQRAQYLEERHAIADEIRLALHAPGIEYAGVVDGARKAVLFREAEVFVLPSYTEGFSLALLEAMYYGLAVVATRVGRARRISSSSPNKGCSSSPATRLRLRRRSHAWLRIRRSASRWWRNAQLARERYELADVARSVVALFDSLESTNTAKFAASRFGINGANRA